MSPSSSVRLLVIAFGAMAVSSGAGAQGASPPRALVTRAVEAMGGEPALRALRTIAMDVTSASFGIGQEETPETPPRLTATQVVRTSRDHGGNRVLSVTESRPGAGAGGVNRTRSIMTATGGLSENNGVQAPAAANAVAAFARVSNQPPERLLLWALDNPGSLRAIPPKTWRQVSMHGVRAVSGQDSVAMYFDPISGYLTVVETITDDPVLGDRSTAQLLTRWTPSGALKYPRQIDVLVNGRVQSAATVTAVTLDGPLADSLFAIPDSIVARARAAAPPAAPPITVQMNQLAPGVWRAEGGSHHSLVIEQSDRVVVIEAPQTAIRSRAVLDTIRGRFAGKPVRQVVMTHHHWDHSGGVREYMAQGVTVVAHERNVAFVRGIAGAPKTVAPDELSRRPRTPAVTPVRDSLVLGSGEARVVLYPLSTSHAEGLLAAYLPAHRLLFTSDVLTPGPTLAPIGSGEIVAFARARGIAVERYAGGHGGIASWADMERAAGR